MDGKRSVTINWLSFYLDGWADLIEDMGQKAYDVNNEFINQITNKGIPDIQIENVSAQPGIFKEEFRDYVLISKSPGLNTLIYIDSRGNDLYTSWRSFVETPVDWMLLLNFALISFGIYLILLLVQLFKQISIAYSLIVVNINPLGDSFHKAILNWLLYSLAIFLLFIFITAIIGKLKRLDWNKFLNESAGLAILLSLVLGYIVLAKSFKDFQSLFQAIAEPIKQLFSGDFATPWIGISIFPIIFFAFFFGALLLGFIIKRDIIYYITIQPDLFHAEDYTAVDLAVHKSMLRALDNQGIPTKKLRLKQEFKGGRKNEVV